MRYFIFFALLIITCSATSRFKSIQASVSLVLRCKNPWSPTANVFLMESDFDDNSMDEDDPFDFNTYEFNVVPEQRMLLQGEEFEISGIEPYLVIMNPCTKNFGNFEKVRINLHENMYRSRYFDVIVNLDTMDIQITRTLMYP